MKTVFLLAALMAYGLSEVQGDLLQFQKIIGKLTRKDALFSYGFYGCYCGWGGRGTPKDATDRCCMVHDCCYLKLMMKGCKPYTQTYNYKYRAGSFTCGSGTFCQKQTCVCDVVAARCMQRNRKTYNPKYRNYPNILCERKNPQC
ncbi:basic phospholipase A2 Sms-N6-like [Gracilinanus agilis]|uniref:basic phospholipase A2 Sms-N6-like n=1 Tax=Gracilinanus agilis TaxID=191870 RepID=UPI001CFD497C|nr:basic phospholipase A2 Sms-N6-like [Gracilinanus agilis]